MKSIPLHLFQFVSGSKLQGYVYIQKNSQDKMAEDYSVKTKLGNESGWQTLKVKRFDVYRDGGTTKVYIENLETSHFQWIYIPAPFKSNEVAYIVKSNQQFALNKIDLTTVKFDQCEEPEVSSVTLEKCYDFKDLQDAINARLSVYPGVSTSSSDVFEHTMLQLAGIATFPFNGAFQFSQSQLKPDHFFMDLGLSTQRINQFVSYFNSTYGQGTAEYMPKFNRAGSCAVCFKINTVIEKVLPDFSKKLEAIFSDLQMLKAYQCPFENLDKNLQTAMLNRFSEEKKSDVFISNTVFNLFQPTSTTTSPSVTSEDPKHALK